MGGSSMKRWFAGCLTFSLSFGLVSPSLAQEPTSRNNPRLKEGLRRYPQADTDGDGVLTMSEAQAFLAKQREAKDRNESKPSGASVDPTFSDVAYGPHARNRLDFWRAKSKEPTAVVVFIHGGGFRAGDKSKWRTSGEIPKLLEAGVSCAAINYRFLDAAPVQDILHDAARAIQFIRSKADAWNIDRSRIAAQGGSAGAGTSLWLATRDDLADPRASDPVLRESSRVCACVLMATQATYDLTRWEAFVGKPQPEWLRNGNEGPEFYGLTKPEDLETEDGKKILAECDMLDWITVEDGAVMCMINQPPGPAKDRGHWLHHPNHALEIEKTCQREGVSCQIVRPNESGSTTAPLAFLLKQLKVTSQP